MPALPRPQIKKADVYFGTARLMAADAAWRAEDPATCRTESDVKDWPVCSRPPSCGSGCTAYMQTSSNPNAREQQAIECKSQSVRIPCRYYESGLSPEGGEAPDGRRRYGRLLDAIAYSYDGDRGFKCWRIASSLGPRSDGEVSVDFVRGLRVACARNGRNLRRIAGVVSRATCPDSARSPPRVRLTPEEDRWSGARS